MYTQTHRAAAGTTGTLTFSYVGGGKISSSGESGGHVGVWACGVDAGFGGSFPLCLPPLPNLGTHGLFRAYRAYRKIESSENGLL